MLGGEGSGLVGWELADQERKKGQNTGNPVDEEGRNAKAETASQGQAKKQGQVGRGEEEEWFMLFMLFMACSSTFPSSRPGNSRRGEKRGMVEKPTSQFNHRCCSARHSGTGRQ